MATPLPSCYDRSLDEVCEARLADFEWAWQEHRPGEPPPRWQDFLPGAGQPCSVAFLFWVLATDVEGRVEAGLPALLAEPYFDDARLSGAGVTAANSELAADLVRHEYRLRWGRGDRARRDDYLRRFPQLGQKLAGLVPQLRCPRCRHDGVPLPGEDADAFDCPRCGAHVRVGEAAPGRTAGAPAPIESPTQAPNPVALASTINPADLPPQAPAGVNAPTHAPPLWQVGRFEVSEEIARGGMGVILRGHDGELRRDVAVKVLLQEHADRPELLRRFVEEAQIAGQLQHPGVVPVYEMGRLPEGQPFFAMKLVKGQTLAELLGRRTSPAEDLPRFLGIFEQVCQAMAYAHSKRVLHRDLKPANVMAGAFGEVLVMDWGLAKVLPEPAPAERPELAPSDSQVRTSRSDPAAGEDAGRTALGSVLGTPAYMAPEQAAGRVDALDERSDVFALGAILCEVLTGKPPYVAAESWQVLYRASLGEQAEARARLDGCGADAELVALAKECLSPAMSDRLRNAAEVARRVAAYQAGVQERLRTAEQQRAAAEARAEQAKATARAEQARLFAEQRLALAHTDLGMALDAKGDAAGAIASFRRAINIDPQLARAHYNLGNALLAQGDAEGAIAYYRQAIDLEPKLTRVHANLGIALDAQGDVAGAIASFRKAIALEPKDAKAHYNLGNALRARGDLAGAVACYRQAIDLEPASAEAQHTLGAALEAKGDAAGAIACYRKAIELEPQFAGTHNRLGFALQARGDTEGAIACYRRAIELDPKDAGTHNNLGHALHEKGDVWGAMACFRKAIDLQPRHAGAHYNLGNALLAQGDLGAAIASYRTAIDLDPTDARAYYNLSIALEGQGDTEGAIACYCEAIDLDAQLALAHSNLGKILQEKGDTAGALACYRRAVELDPKDARAHHNLGVTCYREGNAEDAIACFHKAIDLDPQLARAHYNLGVVRHGKGDVEGAIACYRRAIDLQPQLARAHLSLGHALDAKGDAAGSIACFHKAIDLDPQLAQAHYHLGVALLAQGEVWAAIASYRTAIELDPTDARAHYSLSIALEAKGDTEGAIACYHKAVELDPRLAGTHRNLGHAWHDKPDMEGPIACSRKALDVEGPGTCHRALDLDPKIARADCKLGNALLARGDVTGAIACYLKAIDLDPNLARAHANLGRALYDKGDVEGAIACWRKALDVNPRHAKAHYNLGVALHARGDVEGASACFRHAVALDPKDARAHGALGRALLHRGNFAAAREATRRCLDLLMPQDPHRAPVGRQLADCEQMAALDTRLPAALAGKVPPAGVAEALGLARLCKRYKHLFVAASRFYAGAFAAASRPPDLDTGQRYDAACAAALAGCGQGKDADHLDASERARWRKQALDWLWADLVQWRKRLQAGKPQEQAAAVQTLADWQKDTDQAGVRDEQALAGLPAEEAAAWRKLWADVADLLRHAPPAAELRGEKAK
jgi:serine/threonine-protein kinase